MGSNNSKLDYENIQGIPKEFELNTPKDQNNVFNALKSFIENVQTIENSATDTMEWLNENKENLLNPKILGKLKLISSNGGIAAGVILIILNTFVKEIEPDFKGICKTEITSEISEFLTLFLLYYLKKPNRHIIEKEPEKAQEICNQALDILETFYKKKKFISWADSLEKNSAMKMLLIMYKITNLLGEAYIQIYQGNYKDSHETRILGLMKNMKDQVLQYRMDLIIFNYQISDGFMFCDINNDWFRVTEVYVGDKFFNSYESFNIDFYRGWSKNLLTPYMKKFYTYKSQTRKKWVQELEKC